MTQLVSLRRRSRARWLPMLCAHIRRTSCSTVPAATRHALLGRRPRVLRPTPSAREATPPAIAGRCATSPPATPVPVRPHGIAAIEKEISVLQLSQCHSAASLSRATVPRFLRIGRAPMPQSADQNERAPATMTSRRAGSRTDALQAACLCTYSVTERLRLSANAVSNTSSVAPACPSADRAC